ncbi:hypothetical protein ABL78_0054 [Leptomonas seymouri]|uniref:Uncharacterized protein n=1 Tax=Leptomonas seymouri TaxID=5684 RepID=A0A0N1I9C3_LEPSE|nr:hypothetical protein ABL78_0054 [Leptomonas seymouri]|eukprot:KPI90821.1 hypothetical protein ABL78_0054 [Leptomonas seymouri]
MSNELFELDEANRKVQEWKREAKQSAPVHLSSGVDISLSPADAQYVLPQLTPFQMLRTRDILARLVRLPSITSTALVSTGFGALVTLLLTFHRRRYLRVSRLELVRSCIGKVIRIVLCLLATVAYLRYLRRRYPAVMPVTQYQNLSRVPEYPYFVANRVLTITNSQLGTHADGPHHFCRSLSDRNYDDAHYSGDAVVLDLSADLLCAFPETEPHGITVELMEKACARLPTAFLNKTTPLWRLLLVTQRGPHRLVTAPCSSAESLNALLENEKQQVHSSFSSHKPLPVGAATLNRFAFLYPETIEYLHRVFPRLLLIGIDSPSVDPINVVPLVNYCHGAMLRRGIAIVENLRFNRLRPLLDSGVGGQKNVLVGAMLTVFSFTQRYDDARGCSVVFFPHEEVQ